MVRLRVLFASCWCFVAAASFSQGDTSLIRAAVLEQWVRALSHDSMQGRMSGSSGAQKAALWIATAFRQIKLKPLSPKKSMILPATVETGRLRVRINNVVGVIPGTDPSAPAVYFTAHYDHVGVGSAFSESFPKFAPFHKKTDKDSIFNGANDNASGIAGLLSLARYFFSAPRLPNTLVFAAFDGEEFDNLGSSAYVGQQEPGKVKLVLNLEMLGRARMDGSLGHFPIVTYSRDDKWVIDSLNKYYRIAFGDTSRTKYFLPDPYPERQLYERSDNYIFALEGIPANGIMMTNDQDLYYHHPADEWQTLDYGLMELVLRRIALTVYQWLKASGGS